MPSRESSGLALPSWPEPGTWFFNPLAWQLVFTWASSVAFSGVTGPIPKSAMLYWAAAAALIVAAFGVTDGFWKLPGIRDGLFAHLDLFKPDPLASSGLGHFVVLAYFVSQTRVAAVERTGIGRELQRLGRYSLPIFALGSILSCAGQAVMQAAMVQIPDWTAIIGLVYTLFGILGLFLFARYLERNKPTPHAPESSQEIQSPFSARLLLGLRTRSRALFTKSGASR